MQNFSSLAGLEVAEKLVGLQSHLHVQPNCIVEVEVVLRCHWGCDNIALDNSN